MKPIANLQPFILLGSPYTLKILHDLGYKTFGDYIDESYDIEVDNVKRLQMVAAEVIRIANMSHSEHIELMHNVKHIVEHNQYIFLNCKPLTF